MSTTDNNLVPVSQYDIYSKMLYLASKYTDVSNEDFLRSGLFGYVTEGMSMIMRDSSIHNTMLYNESFLNTAVIPKSIYNWAKMFNININSATPAYGDLTITISEDDFSSYAKPAESYGNKYGSDVSNLSKEKVLIIDKSNNFIAGEYNFMLEHSILIKKNTSSISSASSISGYTARYIQTETKTTEYEKLSSPFLKTVFYTDNYGDGYFSLNCRVYQYKIQTQLKTIASASFIDRKIHEFEFQDQFVDVKCQYIKNGTQDVDLYYSNISNINQTNPYGFYSLLDTNRIQIKFPDGLETFKPSANSQLNVSIITTKGANGNINYTGDVICRLNEEDLRNLPLAISFTNEKVSGGINAPTYSEIKQKIINEISTRDTIVTETDLNNYFSVLKSLLESVNQGEVKFIKKRDDILRRIFTAYILFKDNETNNEYIPADIQTNTVDIITSVSQKQSIPFGASIIQNGTTYSHLENEVNNDRIADAEFIVPFYMYISLAPIRRVKYIYNLANDSTSLAYEKISETSNKILIPSSVSLYRGIEGEGKASDYYMLNFNVSTDFDLSNATGTINLAFKWKSGSTSISSDTVTFNYGSTSAATITTGEINSETGVALSTISIPLNVKENEFNFPSNSEAIGSSYDYGSTINLQAGDTPKDLRLPESATPVITLNLTIAEGNKKINTSFIADKELTFYQNLDNLMSSDIVLNKVTTTEGEVENTSVTSVTIKDVPILNKEFISNGETSIKAFISQLFTYINMLKENLEKLETNTFFDLKFYNTSGLSQMYNTHETEINLELRVRLKDQLDPANYALDIRKYVRSLVSQANDEGVLKVSHIIASTIAKFYDIIENIDFEGLNGTFTQYIKPVVFSNEELKKKLGITPEHFHIPKKYMKNIVITNYDESNVIDYEIDG